MNTIDVSLLLSIVFGLMVCTNIIVQVLKGALSMRISTNLLALIVSFVVTFAAFFVYIGVQAVAVVPWMFVATIGIAFAVAFAAMFGYDKLRELIEQLNKLKATKAEHTNNKGDGVDEQ